MKDKMTRYDLYDATLAFMKEHGITCEETIYQRDSVIEGAYDFIAELYRIIEHDIPKEDEE